MSNAMAMQPVEELFEKLSTKAMNDLNDVEVETAIDFLQTKLVDKESKRKALYK